MMTKTEQIGVQKAPDPRAETTMPSNLGDKRLICAADGCEDDRVAGRYCRPHFAERIPMPIPRDPDAHRAKLVASYGLTEHQYEALIEQQGGGCAICSRPPATTRRLAIDHDHATGIVRGILCGRCNTALGLFDDNPQLLREAIAYLDTTPFDQLIETAIATARTKR
jgi:hypothetical protein